MNFLYFAAHTFEVKRQLIVLTKLDHDRLTNIMDKSIESWSKGLKEICQ